MKRKRLKGDAFGIEEMPWFYNQAKREMPSAYPEDLREYDLNYPGHKLTCPALRGKACECVPLAKVRRNG